MNYQKFHKMIKPAVWTVFALSLAAGSLVYTHNGTPKAVAATPSATTPCVSAPAPTQWKHVVVLMFENKTYGQVVGSSSAPYITNLANGCGTSAKWNDANYNVNGTTNGNYVSKPSYATLTSGVSPTVHGLKDDAYASTTSVDNIYKQLITAGKTGKDYYSGAASSTPCAGSNFSGAYHDAIRYYIPTIGSAYCNSHDVALSTFMTDVTNGTLPEFSMILPTNGENMHDNSISSGDTWAKNFLTPLFDSAQYKSGDTAVFFLWDEDSPIPNVLAAPSIVPGSKVPTPTGNPISHFSATRTWAEMLGLPYLGVTSQAPSLLSFYNGTSVVTPPPPVDNPPAVNLTAPTNGSTLTTSPVTISANATDDVGITKVEFYSGAALLAADTTAPYNYSWNISSLSGSQTLTAKAYDTGGHITTSSAVSVTVSITPVNTCTNTPTNALGVATAVVSTPANGTYHVWSRVMAPDSTNNSYYLQIDTACPILIGDSTAVTTNNWTWLDYKDASTTSHITATLAAGNHTVTMIGREPGVKLDRVLLLSDTCAPSGTGENCADATAPTVAVTTPTSGQTVTGNTTLSATASDNSGGSGIAKVDFLVDGTVVGTSTTSPYQFTWNSTTVADGSHNIQARATDIAGNSTVSTAVSANIKNADTTAPSAPGNLAVTKNVYNEVDLSWTASTDNVGVVGYKVLRNGVALTTTGTATTYKDTTVTANTVYTYTVVALDAANNQSGPSNGVAVTTPLSPDITPPSTPTNLVATVQSSTKVSLTWTASTDNVGVVGYHVERGGVVIGSVTTTTYSDTTVQPSSSYTYTVVAYDAANNVSATSNSQVVNTPALADTSAPSAPTNLVGALSGSQVNLTWTASTDNVGVFGYYVYRNTVRIGSTTTTAFGDATASPGQTYNYYVVAYDAASNVSQLSNQITISVPASTPGSATIKLLPSDDSGLHKSRPNTTYGSGVTMRSDNSPVENFIMKFNVSGVNGRLVTSAKLTLWNIDSSGAGGRFYAAVSNSWSQSSVTWNNAPAASTNLLGTLGSVSKNHFYTLDLTNYIKTDGVYSIRVNTASSDSAAYATREAPTVSHRPSLTLTVQ